MDGNVGFCGGINIADEYINRYEKHGHWKDTAVLLRGDGVWNLTALFLSLWNFSKPTRIFVNFNPGVKQRLVERAGDLMDIPLVRNMRGEDAHIDPAARFSCGGWCGRCYGCSPP